MSLGPNSGPEFRPGTQADVANRTLAFLSKHHPDVGMTSLITTSEQNFMVHLGGEGLPEMRIHTGSPDVRVSLEAEEQGPVGEWFTTLSTGFLLARSLWSDANCQIDFDSKKMTISTEQAYEFIEVTLGSLGLQIEEADCTDERSVYRIQLPRYSGEIIQFLDASKAAGEKREVFQSLIQTMEGFAGLEAGDMEDRDAVHEVAREYRPQVPAHFQAMADRVPLSCEHSLDGTLAPGMNVHSHVEHTALSIWLDKQSLTVLVNEEGKQTFHTDCYLFDDYITEDMRLELSEILQEADHDSTRVYVLLGDHDGADFSVDRFREDGWELPDRSFADVKEIVEVAFKGLLVGLDFPLDRLVIRQANGVGRFFFYTGTGTLRHGE